MDVNKIKEEQESSLSEKQERKKKKVLEGIEVENIEDTLTMKKWNCLNSEVGLTNMERDWREESGI